MQKNHAKAIKGMSIACVALSGVMILICIIGIAAMSVMGPIVQEILADSYYDYGYDGYGSIYGQYGIGSSLLSSHHGFDDLGHGYYYDYYDDYAAYQMVVSLLNLFLGFAIVAEGVILAAGIIVLRNYNKPEKFGMVFIWSIVGAVLGFICSGVVQGVLFIIIAVFVNSDKKLYRAGMYYPAAGAYGVPVAGQPVPPVAPVQAPGQPVPPVQPVQPAAGQPVQPAAAQPVVQPGPAATPDGATQPPSPDQTPAAPQPALEGAPFQDGPVEEIVESVDQIQLAEPAPGADAQPAAQADASDVQTPVVVDEGAVVSIEPVDDQPSEK